MDSKEEFPRNEELPEYVDPEILDIEELGIGGYIELATKGEREQKKSRKRRRAT